VDARDYHKPGEKVRLTFNLNKAHFFNDETDQSIV
jgi:multiple sugar transport system ATP-binding protein